jgi:hypothetical protein
MKPKIIPPRILTAALILLALMGSKALGQNETPQHQSAASLVEEFKNSTVFWKQFEIARKIAILRDTNVLQGLTNLLSNEDRHKRGNTAFIFASLGDDRGFEVIQGILTDKSERPEGQGMPGGNWTVEAQIASDRYYAAHLFGDLKDARAVSVLVPLLHDEDVNYIVPWSLGEIGDKRAVKPLMAELSDKNPSMRVLAIYALEALKAKEALPRLKELLDDNGPANFGELVSVAAAAKAAIAELQSNP